MLGKKKMLSRAAVGFTVKSGWAAVVLLTGSPSSPRVADSRRIDLSDPSVLESRQPYHAGFGTARSEGSELSRLIRSVQQFGSRSVQRLIEGYRADGHRLAGTGLVVGSLADPERLANEHIRIHALEGQLFRTVVAEAAAASELTCLLWRERDLYAAAAEALRRTEPNLRRAATALGRTAEGPWRAEQKTATLAAWLVLASLASGAAPARSSSLRDTQV